jgi:hypothetical protein
MASITGKTLLDLKKPRALARKKSLPISRWHAKNIGGGMNTKIAAMIMAMSLATSLGFSGGAQAKGCIKGAVTGGVAGLYAGHTWTGAAAGCIAGRHYYKQKRSQEQRQLTAPAPATGH